MLVRSMKGLGDNIYQRCFITQLRERVFIDTPWPEIYRDLDNVYFTSCSTTLRTQRKNIERQPPGTYAPNPYYPGTVRVRYGDNGVFAGMQFCFRTRPGPMSLPRFSKSKPIGPYVLLRPPTVRREWRNESRNPSASYVWLIAEMLRERGIEVVSIADLEPGEEWIVGPEPYATHKFHKGELNVERILSLVANATLVVGPVGWIVPAVQAYKKDSIIVFGGNGGFNAPEHITHPTEDTSFMHCLVPDNFCRCKEKIHDCNKHITNFVGRVESILDSKFGPRLVASAPD